MTRHSPQTAEGARFAALLANLALTPRQRASGNIAWRNLARRLNGMYWGLDKDFQSNTLLLGSWGKRTAIRPPTDVDMLFVLPGEFLGRYRDQIGRINAPSRVLQLMRSRLLNHYPDTAIRGDGPVLSVPLASMQVEVVPAFEFGTRFKTCHTSDGGSFRIWDPTAELRALENSNRRTFGNTRDLIRLVKCWRRQTNVPLKPFALELLAVAFLDHWKSAPVDIDEYPRMIAQFFTYLANRARGRVSVPGAKETLWFGDEWEVRASRAARYSRQAITWSHDGDLAEAGRWWQVLFGTYVPLRPPVYSR